MKLLAFAASNSKTSINKQLVTYAASLVDNADVEVLDLNDYELPLFSVDQEAELGSPELAQQFFAKLGSCDAVIVSFAEHNGSYTAAWKNLFDWCSRIDQKIYQNKPVIMLATSPGPRGAQTVLGTATASISHFGGDLRASLSVPSFNDAFDTESGKIVDEKLRSELQAAVQKLN